jgi:hypothetical protein
MIGAVLTLWLWIGFVFGRLSFADAEETSTTIAPELFAKAVQHAKSLAVTTDPQYKQHQKEHRKLLDELENGSVEALFTVAQSLNKRNKGEDRITSVQLWHELADGADHVPSAVALGFSYSEVDKELALKYFVQASNSDQGPHQASLYNAGRLFLELNEAASSLAYIRSCANVAKEYPAYASPELTKTCKEAYELLSKQIMTKTTPGIEDAAELFLYSSIDDFPQPNSREFTKYAKAMEFLEMYASLVREEDATGDDVRKAKAFLTYLKSAEEELLSLKKGSSKKLSELQNFLLDIILGRIQVLVTSTETTGRGDEL